MQIKVTWQDKAAFLACSGTGHRVLMDGPPEGGGMDRGPRPMEMLLCGLGGCSGYDVVSILRKGRQPVTYCEVTVNAQRASTEPRVFTDIHMHYSLGGKGLREDRVQHAIGLSTQKYCSASIMLGAVANISWSFELREDVPVADVSPETD